MTPNMRLITAFGLAILLINNACAQETATQQLKQSLKVIKVKDKTYKAVIAISPSAKADAKAFDQSRGGVLGGMPILVKDNINTLGLPTTAGSLALDENYPTQDAPLIAQIKRAGGLILGKTNLSEWANFRSEKSSSGWSAVGGQTGNAYNPVRSPCGSSAGSGVAVALGYVKVAIGTETNGSIVCPASSNGVVGFKPTHGLVSGDGIVPLASSQDTAGPIADTIENASLVLSIMVSPSTEGYDAISKGLRDLSQARALKGQRIGLLASTLGYDARRDTILNTAIEALKNAGAVIVNDIALKPYDDFWQESYTLLQYEFKRDLNAYLAKLPNKLNSLTLEKLIAFNQQNSELELKHFDQDIFEKSQTLDMSQQDYQDMLKRLRKATREDGLDKLFAEHQLDAIIGITSGPAWLIDHINGDSFFGPSMSTFPAVGGHPHITIPGGKIGGLPVGISFIGKRHRDHHLAQLVFRFTHF